MPSDWSIECADFVNKLIRRKAVNRLGYVGGVKELKGHPWFKNFDWESLLRRELIAPWRPPKADNFHAKLVDF